MMTTMHHYFGHHQSRDLSPWICGFNRARMTSMAAGFSWVDTATNAVALSFSFSVCPVASTKSTMRRSVVALLWVLSSTQRWLSSLQGAVVVGGGVVVVESATTPHVSQQRRRRRQQLGAPAIGWRWQLPSIFGLPQQQQQRQQQQQHNEDDDHHQQRHDAGPITTSNNGILHHHQRQSENTTTNNSTTNNNNNIYGPDPLPTWKQELPPILQARGPKTFQKLTMGNTVEIFLLGTAHVSNDSSADVKMLLEAVHPDCIFVELCEARIGILEGGGISAATTSTTNVTDEAGTAAEEELSHPKGNNNKKKKKKKKNEGFWNKVNEIQQSQGGSRLQAVSTFLLTSVQEDYAQSLGVELGGEFRAAHRYWLLRQQNNNNHGPPTTLASRSTSSSNATTLVSFPTTNKPVSLVLGDRPLSLTLVRAWESLWWWPKTKVLVGLLLSTFLAKPNAEELRAWLLAVLQEESDILTESLAELRHHFPSLHTTIIAERDAWLACKLVQTSRILAEQPIQPVQQPHDGTNHNNDSSVVVSPLTMSSSSSSSSWMPQEPRPRAKKKRIVAIVGAGHVPGIVEWLTGNISTIPTTLTTTATRSRWRWTSWMGRKTTGAVSTPSMTTTTTTTTLSPEDILWNLTYTKKWKNNVLVQTEILPRWIQEVTTVVAPYNDNVPNMYIHIS